MPDAPRIIERGFPLKRKPLDFVWVDECLDTRGLRRNAPFHQLLQALIELAPAGTEERTAGKHQQPHLRPPLGGRRPAGRDVPN